MADHQVILNLNEIEDFFRRNKLGRPGKLGRVTLPRAERVANRMAAQARRNASGAVLKRRTGFLAQSVYPIAREELATGDLIVGVGTTADYGKVLEEGGAPHHIGSPIVGGRPLYLLRSNGPNSKGPNPTPLLRPQVGVNHPGPTAKRWLTKAVNDIAILSWPA